MGPQIAPDESETALPKLDRTAPLSSGRGGDSAVPRWALLWETLFYAESRNFA